MAIKRTFEIDDLTPEEIAAEFCNLHSDDMAKFFNEVARITDGWEYKFCFQLQHVTDEECLTSDARYIMDEIGQYAQKGSV